MTRAPARCALATTCAALLGACSAAPAPPPRAGAPVALHLSASSALLAGVERVDITPPVGLSLAGHGPEGRVATGTRLRLQCTAFVLQQGAELVALVPCELGWISTALHDAVVARARAQGVALEARQLLLTASHTHAGPAHFFRESNYSGPFSSRDAGFDPRVLDFLAERISRALVAAFRARAPATAAWNTVTVRGVAFNQSMEAFLANRSLPAQLRARFESVPFEPAAPGPSSEAPLSPAQRALDPALALLRLDRAAPDGAGARATSLGAYVVFGVHPTAVPNTNDLYHGDLFGFAQREAERLLAADSTPTLVGLSNGIEGDIVAAANGPGFPEARRLGALLGRRIADAYRGATGGSSAVALRAERVDLDLVRHASVRSATETLHLCCDPALGAPSGGGANDGPTRFRLLPALNEGERDPDGSGCHGHKLLLQLGDTMVPGRDFPSLAPLMLVRVGSGWIAAAPAELTTVVGERFRASVALGLGDLLPARDARAPVSVVGLANSYLQYVATRDEYDLQRYEGASTLYGPASEELLRDYFGCLGRAFRVRGSCVPTLRSAADRCAQQPEEPHPEPVARLAERPEADPTFARVASLGPFSADGERGTSLVWHGLWSPDRAPDVHAVHIESADGRSVDDDRGASIETRYYGLRDGRHLWSARWVPELAATDARCAERFRFVVTNERGERLTSEPFRPPCAFAEDP